MRRSQGVWVLALCSAAFLACWATTPARAANKIGERLAGSLGREVVAAAHPSAKVDYQDDNKVPANKKNLKGVGDKLAKRLPRGL